jgi:3-dehydroquinate dehydratase/shikimate dehydrogenase
MTLICASILVHDEAAALADAFAARDAGAEMVEFRIDEFFTGDEPERETKSIVRLLARVPLPCVVTCRLASEGGGFSGDEADRIAMLERICNPTAERVADGAGNSVAEHPPRYIDVEAAAFAKSANIRQKVKLAVDHPEQLRDLSTGLILSMHDFDGRPANLHRRLMEMAEEPAAAVVKVAYRARSIRDNLELLELPRTLNRPTIALGMGKFGLMSRVLAPKFGGFLTFASIRPTEVTAPGQPTIRELIEVYRVRSIKSTTKVFGVVGWPLEQSLSPHVHNSGFGAVGFDGVYVPMPIAADSADPEGSYASFKATMLELLHHASLDFRGCSVTLPHKEHLLRLAREERWRVDRAADGIGAANTLVVGAEHVEVLNTDAPAVADEMRAALGALSGKRALVLGAGGMARAAAYALAEAGMVVTVHNRTHEKARALAESFETKFPGRITASVEVPFGGLDAVINCTSVGMVGGGAERELPLDVDTLAKESPRAVVLDSVYKPRETTLLVRAKRLGLRTIDGTGVFVRQAMRQFVAWTGREAPGGSFEAIVKRELSQRESTLESGTP